jgi:hypothetical protein
VNDDEDSDEEFDSEHGDFLFSTFMRLDKVAEVEAVVGSIEIGYGL